MSTKKKTEKPFPLRAENFKLLLISFGIVILGFILMVGGKSTDPDVFSHEAFNFRRLTLAPIIATAGFVMVIYAIMKKPKEKNSDK